MEVGIERRFIFLTFDRTGCTEVWSPALANSKELHAHITYAPCNCGLMWHRRPAPVENAESQQKADKEEEGKLMRDSGRQGENENGKTGQIKRKCARQIRTRRWRLLDLLLLEARAFSASAWGADGKVGRDYRARVERLSQRGGGGGGAAVLDSCRAKRPKPYKNNSRPCFGTTKHHSEIKDVREQLAEYTIHSFLTKGRLAKQISDCF